MAENALFHQDHSSISVMIRGKPPILATTDTELLQLRSKVKMSATGASTTTLTTTNTIHVSRNSLKNLRRTTLENLQLEESVIGTYIILRTLEPAYKMAGIVTAVEDSNGHGVLFAAYNFTSDPNPDLNDLLPVGTVFILKEPCVKMATSLQFVVVCYSPSDMIVLYKGHELFKLAEEIVWKNNIDPQVFVDPVWSDPGPNTASHWKRRGNQLFKQEKFEYAIRCYLIALPKCEELGVDDRLLQVIQGNLSAAYIRLNFFEKALDFAEKVLMVEPGSRKVLLRAGRACHQLRRYQEAKMHFEKGHDLYPDDKETHRWLKNATNRCLEQETGEFNMYKMYSSKTLHSLQKLECADYVGPIKVIAIQGKGRGVVATRDLEPGTLLVVSKAVAFVWLTKNKTQPEANREQSDDIGDNPEIVADLAQLIVKNPHTFGTMVYDLYDGLQHVNNVSSELFCDPETKLEPIVDVHRLGNILKMNGFGENVSLSFDDDEQGAGLYAMPSYFNHSCLPNALYAIFNDVMFVRTTTCVKAEEEVFLAYLNAELPFLVRQKLCEKRGFQCCCTLCTHDRKSPNKIHYQREGIISNYVKIASQVDLGPRNVKLKPRLAQRQLEKLISEMEATYNSSETYPVKSGLFSMYSTLGKAHLFGAPARNHNFHKVIECFHKTLTVFGFPPQMLLSALDKHKSLIPPNAYLCRNVCNAVASLILIYHNNCQFDVKCKWVEILCAFEKIGSGGDIRAVRLKYADISDII